MTPAAVPHCHTRIDTGLFVNVTLRERVDPHFFNF